MDLKTNAAALGGRATAESEHYGEALGKHPTARRRLPPYGRAVLHARRTGQLRGYIGTSPDGANPTLWLLVGPDAWTVAERWYTHRLLIVAPADEDPAIRDWSCLVDADPVLLVRCGPVDGDHLERLLAAVMRDGVQRTLDLETGVRYVAEEVRDAA